jgi:hypothetical protein
MPQVVLAALGGLRRPDPPPPADPARAEIRRALEQADAALGVPGEDLSVAEAIARALLIEELYRLRGDQRLGEIERALQPLLAQQLHLAVALGRSDQEIRERRALLDEISARNAERKERERAAQKSLRDALGIPARAWSKPRSGRMPVQRFAHRREARPRRRRGAVRTGSRSRASRSADRQSDPADVTPADPSRTVGSACVRLETVGGLLRPLYANRAARSYSPYGSDTPRCAARTRSHTNACAQDGPPEAAERSAPRVVGGGDRLLAEAAS